MIGLLFSSIHANNTVFALNESDSIPLVTDSLSTIIDSVTVSLNNNLSHDSIPDSLSSVNNISISADSVSLMSSDSSTVAIDSISNKNKSFLEAEVEYQARDSIVFYADGTGFLYGDGQVKYQQASPIELKAEYVRFKLDSATIYAIGGVDSTGNPVGNPVFVDNGQEYQSKYMSYNFKTHRAYVKGGVTRQDEGFIVADQTKMFEDQSFFLKDGKYTTCDNHDHPHFYLHITKGKLKPGSFIAAGPAYLVMQDVPLPIAVPFGFFPITNKYSSGVIMPQFGEDL